MVIFYNFKIATNLSEVNKKEVLQVIRNPRAITASQLKEIEKMAVDYPYFQGAHTLVAISNKSRSAPDAPKSVIKAALYATDRKYLKTLLSEVADKQAPKPAAVDPVQKEQPAPEAAQELKQTAPPASQAVATEKPEAPPAQPGAPLRQPEIVEEPRFDHEPFHGSNKTTVLTFSDHDDLLKEVFANLETLKKSKSYYLEVERQLEDAEFEEAQAQAVKKATGSKTSDKSPRKKSTSAPVNKKKGGPGIIENKAKDDIPKVVKVNTRENTSSEVNSVKSTTAKKDPPLKKNDQVSIIDAFIKNNPSIKPATPDSPKALAKDLSEPSQQLKDELVTENLALILVKQGKKEKAVEVYKKLILKVPQKKAYFATQIEELQK